MAASASLSGHPSSRVEPRWELGVWFGKTELTDEHLLGTLWNQEQQNDLSVAKVTVTAKTLWIASWALQRIPSQKVRPKIQRSGDSTSLNDGWRNTVLLLVALAVKVRVR